MKATKDLLTRRLIEFDLHQPGREPIKQVICFANWPTPLWRDTHYEQPLHIKAADDFPASWHPNYKWSELNIMPEAMFKTQADLQADRIDKTSLFHFIGAFLESYPNGIYMHVFHSQLPKQ